MAILPLKIRSLSRRISLGFRETQGAKGNPPHFWGKKKEPEIPWIFFEATKKGPLHRCRSPV